MQNSTGVQIKTMCLQNSTICHSHRSVDWRDWEHAAISRTLWLQERVWDLFNILGPSLQWVCHRTRQLLKQYLLLLCQHKMTANLSRCRLQRIRSLEQITSMLKIIRLSEWNCRENNRRNKRVKIWEETTNQRRSRQLLYQRSSRFSSKPNLKNILTLKSTGSWSMRVRKSTSNNILFLMSLFLPSRSPVNSRVTIVPMIKSTLDILSVWTQLNLCSLLILPPSKTPFSSVYYNKMLKTKSKNQQVFI